MPYKHFSPQLKDAYSKYIKKGVFLESSDYYERYRSRYLVIMEQVAGLKLPRGSRLLEIGGGQNAILAMKVLGFDSTVCDVSYAYSDNIKQLGIRFLTFNLVEDEPFCERQFDVVILSEVIEHIPVPGHLVLGKIRKMLSERGTLILTTPNLYSGRNIVHLILGKELFGHFFYPSQDEFCSGHILEYSREHLAWQLEKAGFSGIRIDFCQFDHRPRKLLFRILYLIGRPILKIKRFRQNLLAVAKK